METINNFETTTIEFNTKYNENIYILSLKRNKYTLFMAELNEKDYKALKKHIDEVLKEKNNEKTI